MHCHRLCLNLLTYLPKYIADSRWGRGGIELKIWASGSEGPSLQTRFRSRSVVYVGLVYAKSDVVGQTSSHFSSLQLLFAFLEDLGVRCWFLHNTINTSPCLESL
ncbi:hypothetical protein AVEN_205593-1 [Araneus ventricosus]|uniref:Uncharacterized protein n=1 Tax=Araneus ventricosus TaxID=182803 RepID=A0A4Y2F704_ARAVE|nr:hypothetical protein AVEN_205593-1 [Araneus ventricosus]